MAIELEGLEFQIEAGGDNVSSKLDALAESLGRIKTAAKGFTLSRISKQISGLNTSLNSLQVEKLTKLGSALQSISNVRNVRIPANLSKQIGSLAGVTTILNEENTNKLMRLGTVIQGLESISNIRIPKTIPDRIRDIGDASSQLTDDGLDRLERLGNLLQSFRGLEGIRIPRIRIPNTENGENTEITETIAESLREAGNEATNLTGHIEEAENELHNAGNEARRFCMSFDSMSSVTQQIKKISSGLWNIFSFIPKKTVSPLINSFKQATAGAGQFLSSIKRIAMYRLIRTALSAITQGLKEGIDNLYQYSAVMGGEFKKSMDSIATNALYLKNSLGAMVSPIINALAPAIEFLTDKIAHLLNMVNMLIARLTGKSTYTAAKKVAAQYADIAGDTAKKVKDNVDKIKSYTIGIDELNIIEDMKDLTDDLGGGSGSGGGAGYGDMFEELPITQGISDFADKLKEAFNNGDWQELGQLLGNKINEMVEKVPWAGIGDKLGYGLNGAIQTAYYFLDTIDFTNIGGKIAILFNHMFDQIDFSYIGGLLVKRFTIVWDLIIGFFTTLDWGLVARKFSEGFIGIFNELSKWLDKYDWGQLTDTVYQKVKDFIANVKWTELAESFFTLLGKALGAACSIIGTVVYDIMEDVVQFFRTGWTTYWDKYLKDENGVKKTGKDLIAGLWEGIKNAFTHVGQWIKEHIVDPFVKGFKETFGIHSPSTLMMELGGYVIEGFKEGILKPFKDIKNWVDTHIGKPLREAFDNLSVGEFTVNVKNDVTKWWGNVKRWWSSKDEKVKEFTTNVTDQSSQWWTSVKTWWSGKVGKVKEFWTWVTDQSAGWWADVNIWWNGKVGKVKEFWTWVTDNSSGWWTSVNTWWNGRVGKVKEFWTWVTDNSAGWWADVNIWWNNKVGKVKEFWTWVTDNSEGWWTSVNTWWNGRVGKVKEFWTWVTDNSAGWWADVNIWWNNKVGKVKEFWTWVTDNSEGWWTSVNTWWNNKVGKVKEFWTWVTDNSDSWWSDVKTWWNNKVGNAGNFSTDVNDDSYSWWEKVKNWWNGYSNYYTLGNFDVSVNNNAESWWSDVKSWWNNAAGYLTTTLSINLPKLEIDWDSVQWLGHTFTYPKFTISWYAKGAILDGAQIFGMLGDRFLGGGEAGQEAVLPLDQHTEWMDSIAEKVKNSLPNEDEYSSFKKALVEFYGDYVEAAMNQLVIDMKRQADKSESTTVQIGNKTVKDTLITQQRADGYSFVR